ncbi:MAG: nicotinate phosphoribosyltransferase [Deltaproteobacteria bacterium]|nr:nicotinate phosphoribosyltransferase [Deltaproteobacteria bacterium]
MPTSQGLYGSSLGLLTDLYQLTMSYAHLKNGLQDTEAVFNLFFRKLPFQGGFAVCCGLEDVIQYLERYRFAEDDLAYLSTLRGGDGAALFDESFLRWLGDLKLSVSVDAIPEGTLVFAHEPLIRVQGPIVQCQLLETVLLNLINFQTLIATKAARICLAARGERVMEFGLRRAQGMDGAMSACRAAYVGGCAATSNVLAGKVFGIPVAGTHAHSWVMCFETELEAFDAYARALPNNCIFLVDTYDSLEGVRHAVQVGRRLSASGHRLAGIRLDSGDLAWLSVEARKILDASGFQDVSIVGSNDLDEHLIESLKGQGAAIAVWGVGTRLVTAYEEPALGGVYKVTALRRPGEPWQDKLKLSERSVKTTTPGILQVRRYRTDDSFIADAIYDTRQKPEGSWTLVDPNDPTRTKTVAEGTAHVDLLVPVMRGGERIYQPPALAEIRARTKRELECLHPASKRFANPHEYPVGLERSLHQRRMELIVKLKKEVAASREGAR